MLQAGLLGSTPSSSHQSVSRAGRGTRRVAVTATRTTFSRVCHVYDGVPGASTARISWPYIWRSGRNCRALAYRVQRSRSSSPSPRSGDGGLEHSERGDIYFQGVPGPQHRHSGVRGNGSREDPVNRGHRYDGHLPHLANTMASQRTPDNGPADVQRHANSHGEASHLQFGPEPSADGGPASTEEGDRQGAGHTLPMLDGTSQQGSGVLGEAAAINVSKHDLPKHDLPAAGLPHMVAKANHHQVNGHTLPTLRSSGQQASLNGHFLPMVSSANEGASGSGGVMEGLGVNSGKEAQEEKSASQPDTRSREELLAENRKLTESLARADAYRFTAEQRNIALTAELNQVHKELWDFKQMEADRWKKLRDAAGHDTLRDALAAVDLELATTSLDSMTLPSPEEQAESPSGAPASDAAPPFSLSKSSSPLRIRDTTAKLINHFMGQRTEAQSDVASEGAGEVLAPGCGPEPLAVNSGDMDAQPGADSNSELSPGHAGPATALPPQASEAMAKFEQQLREARSKGLRVQEKVQRGLRSLSPSPEARGPQDDAGELEEGLDSKGLEDASASREEQLEIAMHLQQWLLGEGVELDDMPAKVQTYISEYHKQKTGQTHEKQEPAGKALPRKALRPILENLDKSMTGVTVKLKAPLVGTSNMELAAEAAAKLKELKTSGSDQRKRMPLDDYLLYLMTHVDFVSGGEYKQLDVVLSLERYFRDINVKSLEVWGDPAVLFPKPLFGKETKEKVNAIWEKIVRMAGYSKKVSKKTRIVDKVVVFGGGSFATAMAVAVARAHRNAQVVMLLRDVNVQKDINENHMNSKYLKGLLLEKNISAVVPDDDEGAAYCNALKNVDYVIHAMPVQQSRKFLSSIKDWLADNVPIIAASKGLEESTALMMSEIIPEALGRKQPAVFISGPSFAAEIVRNNPTALVAASHDLKLAQEVALMLKSEKMTVSTSQDVIGVEICGALKNVLAIAIGIVRGSNMGDNSKAALLTYGFAEITQLVVKAGGNRDTMLSPAGFGDIVMTCYGDQSRNGKVGYKLGQGMTIEEITASQEQVAEGVHTAPPVLAFAAKHKCNLPIITAVTQVITGEWTSKQASFELLKLATATPDTLRVSDKSWPALSAGVAKPAVG